MEQQRMKSLRARRPNNRRRAERRSVEKHALKASVAW
jgi:hypothetical protein